MAKLTNSATADFLREIPDSAPGVRLRNRYSRRQCQTQPIVQVHASRYDFFASTDVRHYVNQLVSQGYKPVVVCGYSDGVQDRYAAIFRQISGAPAWQARHGLTPAQYQATFDQLVGEGYRLELVNGFSIAGQDRFAALWTK